MFHTLLVLYVCAGIHSMEVKSEFNRNGNSGHTCDDNAAYVGETSWNSELTEDCHQSTTGMG